MAGTVDVEHDGFFLKHVLEDTGYPEIATIIKRAFDTVIPRKAIDFRTNVGRVIQQCLSMHGVPMFRTKYAGEPFGAGLPGGAFVLMVCYGSHDGKLKGVWFKGVPPEDLDMLAAKKDGYMLMLRKYGHGAAAYTGQIVSEAVSELRYAVDGEYVAYEEFEKAWLREFPRIQVPSEPGYFRGGIHTFTIVIPGPGASIEEIKSEIRAMIADEEKAAPAYSELRGKMFSSGAIKPLTIESDIMGRIIQDEERHKKDLERILERVSLIQIRQSARAAQRILV